MYILEELIEFMHEFVERFRVFFFLDSQAQPIHSFALVGGHLAPRNRH